VVTGFGGVIERLFSRLVRGGPSTVRGAQEQDSPPPGA